MAIILQQPVTVFDGISQFSAKKAVIELHDDDHFVLYKIDEATGAITETVMNVWLRDLEVSGSQAMLVFKSAGIKKRVDFSFGSRLALAAGGVAGIAVAGSLAKKSGIGAWVDAFKARGVPVKFMTFGKLMGISFAIVGGILVVTIVAVVIGASLS
jgi:hypothetical protein